MMNKAEAGGGEIKAYLGVIRRWLWLIALAILLPAAATLVMSVSATPIYAANAILLVGQSQATGMVDYNMTLLNEQVAKTSSRLLTEKPVLRDASTRLGLPTDDASLARLSHSVSADLVKDTQLIRLSVRNANPRLAAELANTILAAYIERMQGSLAEGYAASLQALSGQMDIVQSEIDSTQNILDSEQANADADAAIVGRLEATLRQLRSTYDGLQQNHSQLKAAQMRGNNSLMVFDKAEIPTRPAPSRTMMNVALACVVGALLSTGTAFFVENLDDTIKRPEDIQQAAGLPVLSTVARFPEPAAGRGLVMSTAPERAIAEGYGALRTGILLSARGRSAQVLLFTGTRAGVGTTTVLSNFALSLAQVGKRVLLVDANLARPALHAQFDLPNDVGLGSFLLGRTDLEASIQQTSIAGLGVITAGPAFSSPAQALHRPEMSALLERSQKLADYVLVDGPAVLQVADACLLAQKAGGTVLVAEMGATSTQELRRSVSMMEQCKIDLLGAVLNKAPKRG